MCVLANLFPKTLSWVFLSLSLETALFPQSIISLFVIASMNASKQTVYKFCREKRLAFKDLCTQMVHEILLGIVELHN